MGQGETKLTQTKRDKGHGHHKQGSNQIASSSSISTSSSSKSPPIISDESLKGMAKPVETSKPLKATEEDKETATDIPAPIHPTTTFEKNAPNTSNKTSKTQGAETISKPLRKNKEENLNRKSNNKRGGGGGGKDEESKFDNDDESLPPAIHPTGIEGGKGAAAAKAQDNEDDDVDGQLPAIHPNGYNPRNDDNDAAATTSINNKNRKKKTAPSTTWMDKKVLIVFEVDMGESRIEKLEIREGQKLSSAIGYFCRLHNLNLAELAQPLEKYLRDKAPPGILPPEESRESRSKPGGGGKKGKKMIEQREGGGKKSKAPTTHRNKEKGNAKHGDLPHGKEEIEEDEVNLKPSRPKPRRKKKKAPPPT